MWENKKIRQLILEEGIKGKGGKIVASEELQNRLVENNLALAISLGNFAAQNPNILGLEPGKRINAQQFISGYYTELSKLAGTYDASVNEFGQYLNTILPLRYGDILAAEKAGAVEGAVALEDAREIEADIDEDLTPDDIPNRTWGTTVTDTNTKQLTLAIMNFLDSNYNIKPHVIINNLKRTKLDANRDKAEAAQGDVSAERAFDEYHFYISKAKEKILSQYNDGLFLDIHGHGQNPDGFYDLRTWLGYLLSSSELDQSDEQLDTEFDISESKY